MVYKILQYIDVSIGKRVELHQALVAFSSSTGPAFLDVMTDMEEVVYPVISPGK